MSKISTNSRASIDIVELSAVVDEIISNNPGFIVRNGSLIILVIILSVIAYMGFIKYPNIIKTTAKLNYIYKNYKIFKKNDLQIPTILVKDSQYIKKGDVMGYYVNIKVYNNILFLKAAIDSINIDEKQTKLKLDYLKNKDLGDFEKNYLSFYHKYIQFHRNVNYKVSDSISSKENVLDKQQRDNMLNNIKLDIYKWENENLIIAKDSGIICLLSDSLNKNANEILNISITHYSMKALISQKDMEQIKLGEKVVLKFTAYPWQTYGIVDGVISSNEFSIYNSNELVINISLPKGLVTSHLKSIKPIDGLSASAEIITNSYSFLEKLYPKSVGGQ